MSRRDRLEALLQDDPRDPFLHYALAMEYEKEGDLISAARRLGQLNIACPDYIAAYHQRGRLLMVTGETGEARLVLEEGIRRASLAGETHAAGEMQGLLETL